MVSACLLMTLTACEPSGIGADPVQLAAVPADIRVCFNTLTGKPMPGQMTKAQVVALIAALRRSEKRLSYCGKRMLALYDSQRNAYMDKHRERSE